MGDMLPQDDKFSAQVGHRAKITKPLFVPNSSCCTQASFHTSEACLQSSILYARAGGQAGIKTDMCTTHAGTPAGTCVALWSVCNQLRRSCVPVSRQGAAGSWGISFLQGAFHVERVEHCDWLQIRTPNCYIIFCTALNMQLTSPWMLHVAACRSAGMAPSWVHGLNMLAHSCTAIRI